MITIIRHAWKKETGLKLLELFRGQGQFFTADPGDKGGIVHWVDFVPVWCAPFKSGRMLEALKERCTIAGRQGRITIIHESQFVGINSQSALSCSWSAGMICGALAMCSERGVETIGVPPKSWQNPLARHLGRKPTVGDETKPMVRAAMARAPLERGSMSTDDREGVDDALGIGAWWVSELRDGLWPGWVARPGVIVGRL